MAIVANILSVTYPHTMAQGDIRPFVFKMQQHSDSLADILHPDTFRLDIHDATGTRIEFKLIDLPNDTSISYSLPFTMPNQSTTLTAKLWFLDTIVIPGIIPELLMDVVIIPITLGATTIDPTTDDVVAAGTDWEKIAIYAGAIIIGAMILKEFVFTKKSNGTQPTIVMTQPTYSSQRKVQ